MRLMRLTRAVERVGIPNRNPSRLADPRSNGGYLGLLRCGQLYDVLGVAVPDGLRGTGQLLVVDDPLLGELQQGEARGGLGVLIGERQFGDGRLYASSVPVRRGGGV